MKKIPSKLSAYTSLSLGLIMPAIYILGPHVSDHSSTVNAALKLTLLTSIIGVILGVRGITDKSNIVKLASELGLVLSVMSLIASAFFIVTPLIFAVS